MTVFEQIATKVILSTALLSGANLLATEPQAPTPQEPSTPERRKNWNREQIFEQIGSLKSTCDMIDQFFSTHSEHSSSASDWKREGKRFKTMLDQTRTDLGENPSQVVLNLSGQSLENGNAALRLYLNRLLEDTAQRGASPSPIPAVVGIYDETDLVGMQAAAKTLQSVYQQHLQTNGRSPTPLERKVMSGLDKITSARAPRELSESLQPVISEALIALTNDTSVGSSDVRASFTKLLSGLKPSRNLPTSGIEKDSSADKNWKSWNDFLANDLKHRLAIGGKIARAETLTIELAKTSHGLKVIAFGAARLSELYKSSNPDVSKQLSEISQIQTKEQFDQLANGVRVFAEATVRSQINQIGEK